MIVDFEKTGGLVPVVVQNAVSFEVLMLAYMNQDALEATMKSGLVTFYSRSRQSLWTKGETSGHFLKLVSIKADCDGDTLLIMAEPAGPVCHTGSQTCFGEEGSAGFLYRLEHLIKQRKLNPGEQSYTASLLSQGTAKLAQKVGEEAVEVVIEAMGSDRDRYISEVADLLYHLLVLNTSKDIGLSDIENALYQRSKQANK